MGSLFLTSLEKERKRHMVKQTVARGNGNEMTEKGINIILPLAGGSPLLEDVDSPWNQRS